MKWVDFIGSFTIVFEQISSLLPLPEFCYRCRGTQFYFQGFSSVFKFVNPLSAKFIKWSNTLKQFVGKLPTNCLSVFDHFSGLALKGLMLKKSLRCSKVYCAMFSRDTSGKAI